MKGDGLRERARDFDAMLGRCTLCPRRCRVDRTAGERGFCGISTVPRIACALPHHGEEPPLSGVSGAGTIFFSSCTLRCVYCQNHEISHARAGFDVSTGDIADMIVRLARQGCHNIEAVTPTPHLAPFLYGLAVARDEGVTLPVVYNSSGYESAEVIRMLDGVVDIYLPDCKYGTDCVGVALSRVNDYVSSALAAIRAMVAQVGSALVMRGNVATRGVIIRHLVLPGMVENSLAVLRLLAENVPLTVPLSIMAQYTPTPQVRAHPSLGRTVTETEYRRVVDAACEMGFEYLFVQDVSDAVHDLPDFSRDDPFEATMAVDGEGGPMRDMPGAGGR